MRLFYGSCTEKGIREENQDSIMVLKTSDSYTFAVADGIGGLDSGKRASQIAIKALETEFAECDVPSPKYLQELLRVKLKQISKHIYDLSDQNSSSMGTTLSALVFSQDWFVLANVGDTKVFLVRDNHIQTISKVHSLKEDKHVLTMAIGPYEEIDPYIFQGVVRKGDKYIICSDGVYNFVEEAAIIDFLRERNENSNEALDGLCKELIKLALINGSGDNLSIIAIYAL